jgi:hypothetical protein
MLLHNAIADGQPHACAFADGFGGEKRVEQLGLDMVGNARTIVFNGDRDSL